MFSAKDGRRKFWISAAIFLVFVFLAPNSTPAQTAKTRQTSLRGQVPAVVANLQPLGRLDGSTNLNLSIGLPLRDREALANLLQQLYDPASPLYRHYLSPEEFTARFGPTEADYQTVVDWATRSGFAITGGHDSRMLLEVSAQAADVERALHVTMQNYEHPKENRIFFAPDREPSVDAGLPIENIGGLNDFGRPHPKSLRRIPLQKGGQPSPKIIGSGPNGNLWGLDYRAAYAPGITLTGTGQSVGLLEFDNYFATDITSYESLALPGVSVPIQKVSVAGFNVNGEPGEGNLEVALDIEVVISMAPNLSSVVVFEASPSSENPYAILESMSSSTYTNIKQFSCSWGFEGVNPGDTTMDGYFMKFDAQGQSFFDAVGDTGAFTNGIPILPPGDDPYITQVGGTALGTAGSTEPWLSETVWDAYLNAEHVASSGGVSTYYTIATYAPWQKGVSMSANRGSKTYRNVPDVAAVADNVAIVDEGQEDNVCGTSCSAPIWAGFTALVNEQAIAAGKTNVGFLNPALYNIGTNSGYTACFDDVTIGDNTNSNPNDYYAVPGYDLCTGWGSPTGSSLMNALIEPDGFQITPGRGAVANGPVGGPFSVASQTLTLTNTGKTVFNWTLSAAPAWLDVSSTSGTLTPNAEGESVVLSPNSAADLLSPGVYTANIWFTNMTSGLAQNRQFTLQVDQELVLDGGFESGDFAYWTLWGKPVLGDASIYLNNFVDYAGGYSDYTPYSGEYFAALGSYASLGYISQPLPTSPGQYYLLSFWLENTNGEGIEPPIPNQFQIQWNSNTTSANIIFNQNNMGLFAYSNMQFLVQASSETTTLVFGATNYAFFALDDVSVKPVQVPVPAIQAPTVVNGSLQLTWTSYPGVSYQVQSASSLTPSSWTDVGGLIPGTGSTTTVSESIGSGAQLFYRVVIPP